MRELLSQAGHKIAELLQERTEYGIKVESPSLKLINQYLSYYPINSLLPYRSYDSAKEIFHNENSIGFVLETYPMVGCTEEMQREISGLFQHTLPEGSNIQLILWASPRVGSILHNWKSVRKTLGNRSRRNIVQENESQNDTPLENSSQGIFHKLAERRTSHLREMVFGSDQHLTSQSPTLRLTF